MRALSNRQLVVVGGVLIAIAFLSAFLSAWPFEQEAPVSQRLSVPPLTASESQQLQQMPTFQYLVSYTNSGFQPSSLTVKKGNIIRFTNNSSGQLWVASEGEGGNEIYPGTSQCGGSSFDSCITLNSGDFWQFQFTNAGTWSFQNNLDKARGATITVTVK